MKETMKLDDRMPSSPWNLLHYFGDMLDHFKTRPNLLSSTQRRALLQLAVVWRLNSYKVLETTCNMPLDQQLTMIRETTVALVPHRRPWQIQTKCSRWRIDFLNVYLKNGVAADQESRNKWTYQLPWWIWGVASSSNIFTSIFTSWISGYMPSWWNRVTECL